MRLSVLSQRQDGYVNLDNFSCSFPGLAGNLRPPARTPRPTTARLERSAALMSRLRRPARYVINKASDNNLSFDYTDSRDTASPDTLIAPPQYDTQNQSPGATAANAIRPTHSSPMRPGMWLKGVGGPLYGLPLGAPLGPTAACPVRRWPQRCTPAIRM